MPTAKDIIRMRESTNDNSIMNSLLGSDSNFKTAVDRVRTANPNLGALEEAKFPSAMLDLFYDIKMVEPEPMATSSAARTMERTRSQEAAQQGLVGGIKEDIQERGERFGEGLERQRAGEQNILSTGLQLAGETVGGVFDVVGETVGAAFRLLPDFIEEPIREGVSNVGDFFAETEGGQEIMKAIQQGAQLFEQLKETNPEAAENLRALANIASIIPVGRVTGAVERGVVGRAAEGRLAKQVTGEAIEATAPVLAKAERISALEAGRGKGAIKRTVEPSKIDIKVAASVEDIVKPGRPLGNIDRINKKIASSAKALDENLNLEGGIFNEKEILSALNKAKVESEVLFAGDKALESAYDSVINQYMKFLREEGLTVGGSNKARIKLDQFMKKKFPKLFDKIAGDNTRANAVFDVRRAVNDFNASKLPEGNTLRRDLLRISDMYTARKNIATRLQSSIDIGIAERAIKVLRDNPLVAGATGGILTFGALTGLLSNPIVLGGLLAGGSVKIGAKVITSKTLKKALIAAEGAATKTKDIAAITALRELFDQSESDLPPTLVE